MIIQFVFNLLYLLSLVPKFHKLVLLLLVVLLYQFVQVPDLLVEVLVDVHQLGFSHFKHCFPLCVQYLHFFLAEIELFACLINFFLLNKKVSNWYLQSS
jgi:hypothetical protein